jgi:hypothetical protein
VDRIADILEQLAGDQRLGVERHVADRAARAVEMRREGQAVDAAGRTRQDRGGAAHAQPDAQRAEGRAHALRLVVRAARIVGRILLEQFTLAGRFRGARQLLRPPWQSTPATDAAAPRFLEG